MSTRSARNRFRKGVTALEFALIAPVFFLMFIGLIETSLIMLVQHLLENATFNASRLAKTGFVAEEKTQLETVMDVLYREMGSLSPLVQTSKLTFSSEVFGNINDIPAGEGGEGLGTASQVVVYTVGYPWKVFTPMIGEIIGDQNGIVRLSSRIVVRNEPYN
ncbi:MAG: pilus assembly protein [Alphaproteobacteria bacterium]|nr:pilus assembly protein [Alphaproteobacteria bacterium]